MIPEDIEKWVRDSGLQPSDLERLLQKYRTEEYLKEKAGVLSVEHRITRFLENQKTLKNISLALIAEHLCMSERTLCRNMQKEDIRFKELLNRERQLRCYRYIQSGITNGTELSGLLGFSDTDYFYKVFKQWADCSFREAKRRIAKKP